MFVLLPSILFICITPVELVLFGDDREVLFVPVDHDGLTLEEIIHE